MPSPSTALFFTAPPPLPSSTARSSSPSTTSPRPPPHHPLRRAPPPMPSKDFRCFKRRIQIIAKVIKAIHAIIPQHPRRDLIGSLPDPCQIHHRTRSLPDPCCGVPSPSPCFKAHPRAATSLPDPSPCPSVPCRSPCSVMPDLPLVHCAPPPMDPEDPHPAPPSVPTSCRHLLTRSVSMPAGPLSKSPFGHAGFAARPPHASSCRSRGSLPDLDRCLSGHCRLFPCKILKDLKKEFCCNGTVVQDPELGQVIQLQGDQWKNVAIFLVQAGIMKKEHIKIHGF